MPQEMGGGILVVKTISEKILAEANQRGFNVSIYRLPQILGSISRGSLQLIIITLCL